MKLKKTAKLLSTVLALAISACSLTGMAGVTSSAADSGTTTDYSAVYAEKGEQWRLKINDYYTTLNMYDGAGLGIKEDGVLAMDTDWRWQVNSVDTAVELTSPYAIYNIAENTEFTAVFSDTTDFSKVNVLVSRDMVSWTDAEPDISGKTLKIGTPNDISFVKIVLPTDNDRSTGIKSVTYTKAENAANVYRYDYATITGGSMLGSGKEDPTVLVNRGVWESRQLLLLNSGVFRPNDNDINNATTADSFNGYATYKVQPGTRFGFTVTGNRGLSAAAGKLGFGKETDWTIEVYGSADNVAFEKLNVKPVFSARYSNLTNNDAKRSADWNFIVPDNMVYIKLKFPITQNLSTQMVDGSPVWPWSGNDLFEINRVEYTGLKYDYHKAKDGDYYIEGTPSSETKNSLGVYAFHSDISRDSDFGNVLEGNWNGMYYNRHPYIQYKVQSGTAFHASFMTMYQSNVNGYVAVKDYVIKLKGLDIDGNWIDVKQLTLNSENKDKKYHDIWLSAAENKYSMLKFVWPDKASEKIAGNTVLGLMDVSFTATEKVVHDYTVLEGQTGFITSDNFANYDIYSAQNVTRESAGWLDTDWMRQYNGGKTWVVYNVKPGTEFHAWFNKWDENNLKNYIAKQPYDLKIQGSNGSGNENDEWTEITNIKISSVDDFAATYAAHVTAEQNNYKFIRIHWPERADTTDVGDNCLPLTGVAFTPYSEDAPTYKNGDVNGDNEVDLLDYVKLKKIIAGVDTSTGADPDLDGNGVANGKDLTLLRKYLIGAIDTL